MTKISFPTLCEIAGLFLEGLNSQGINTHEDISKFALRGAVLSFRDNHDRVSFKVCPSQIPNAPKYCAEYNRIEPGNVILLELYPATNSSMIEISFEEHIEGYKHRTQDIYGNNIQYQTFPVPDLSACKSKLLTLGQISKKSDN